MALGVLTLVTSVLMLLGCTSSPESGAPRGSTEASADAPDSASEMSAAEDRGQQSPSAHGDGVTRWWAPAVGVDWQWQLSGEIDTTQDAEVYELDGFDTPASTVQLLHERGIGVICYISAGSYEPWRRDADVFPEAVVGEALEGWPDERWLDIREIDILKPIISARFEMCTKKGFDAVEADNVDGYQNRTGFPLTAGDQLAYNRMIADLAHSHGLGVALKNDVDQATLLEPYFDFAVNEECLQNGECHKLRAFVAAKKAVLHAEYEGSIEQICQDSPAGFSSILKEWDLGAWRETCARRR